MPEIPFQPSVDTGVEPMTGIVEDRSDDNTPWIRDLAAQDVFRVELVWRALKQPQVDELYYFLRQHRRDELTVTLRGYTYTLRLIEYKPRFVGGFLQEWRVQTIGTVAVPWPDIVQELSDSGTGTAMVEWADLPTDGNLLYLVFAATSDPVTYTGLTLHKNLPFDGSPSTGGLYIFTRTAASETVAGLAVAWAEADTDWQLIGYEIVGGTVADSSDNEASQRTSINIPFTPLPAHRYSLAISAVRPRYARNVTLEAGGTEQPPLYVLSRMYPTGQWIQPQATWEAAPVGWDDQELPWDDTGFAWDSTPTPPDETDAVSNLTLIHGSGTVVGSALTLTGDALLDVLIALYLADGNGGGLYDAARLDSLYQDTAGTIPAAADDPVGLMLDLSGNGHHLTQSTDANRPILRTDGTLWWLEFDGVNDHLILSGGVPTTANQNLFAAFRPAAGASTLILSINRTAAGLFRGYLVTQSNTLGSANSLRFGVSDDDVVDSNNKAASAVGAVDQIVVGQADKTDLANITGRRNGSDMPNAFSGGIGGVGNNFVVGANSTASSLFWPGRIYAIGAHMAAMSTANRAALEAYLAARAGITL